MTTTLEKPKKKTLPELFDLLFQKVNQLSEANIDPEEAESLLEEIGEIEGEKDKKVEGYVSIINRQDNEISVIKAEMDRLKKRIDVRENKKKYLKQRLQEAMEHYDINKIETPLITVNLQNSQASCIIDNEKLIPEDWKRDKELSINKIIERDGKYYERVIDKKAIADHIKKGGEVSGAHLEQGKHIRIR